MPRKSTPKPMAPRYLLEELWERQQTLINQHLSQLSNWHTAGLQNT